MPVITFLQDVFSMAKGPYHHKIGRHTQRFCSKAAKCSTNEMQKKIFFVTAICADEFVAALLGVDNKRHIEPFKKRTLKTKIAKQQIVITVRIYMSAILTLISSQKEILLLKTGLEEQELLRMWCSIFEYGPSDMQLFNELLLPAYQHDGIDGLSMSVGKSIIDQLFVVNDTLNPSELEMLQRTMIEDITAVLRLLEAGRVEAS
ncbi:hypothetical protein SAMN04515679_4387 [Pelosinus fermentans]|uniref:Uncharacterized protein n=2 Tax=Pelosinus TaxID=365348 RepID=I9LFQ4_9FIRM|nr:MULTISPECIES: hypothetical protein [Pelosinus]EIW19211.1 hypothetical protein FB4_2921 [Pelosinus fermentans B4]EIW25057.1 hypothetical protein FA11_2917 [Pelosinus fermentans A11]OAM96192.1 hypothetical protein FR7_04214 [Pelosinus fermentans DSM 17108]SDR37376.1 hypothetical protein SAMN04515679_4387 [Pelosinus fermentans]